MHWGATHGVEGLVPRLEEEEEEEIRATPSTPRGGLGKGGDVAAMIGIGEKIRVELVTL